MTLEEVFRRIDHLRAGGYLWVKDRRELLRIKDGQMQARFYYKAPSSINSVSDDDDWYTPHINLLFMQNWSEGDVLVGPEQSVQKVQSNVRRVEL